MSLFHLALVAIIQGLTEFLPVSSSGHLALVPHLTNLNDQGQAIDVAVHVGTLFAVILYFRADVSEAISGVPRLLQGKVDTQAASLAFALLVATIPVVIFGTVLFLTGLSQVLRSVAVIGWAMLIFGFVLYWTDQRGQVSKTKEHWTPRDAFIMGLWQAIALIPGTSRSGATISGARALGYDRENAARLAMLMSIPTIAVSGIAVSFQAFATVNLQLLRDGAIAAVLAFISALLALGLMMRLLKSVSFTPYVIYRIIVGFILLGIAYS
ncbi:MAG: undecaprenyl-diphosphate phosphatase [Paracoccaceae bacterium]